MNKRIQDLILRTDAWCEQNLPANWTDDVDQYLPLWNAKFAELIVRECAKEALKFWCYQVDCSEESAQSHIKKHFGVEE